jgi:serine/threonine-protein kinase ATR
VLGLIGCLDPNRIETIREKREILVPSNFERADETIDFVLYFLEEVLVKFLSATNTKAQGFLAYAMQEFLKFCELEQL